MYCPHCGTELPEPAWDGLPAGGVFSEVSCPNEDCGKLLRFEDHLSQGQEGPTEITIQ